MAGQSDPRERLAVESIHNAMTDDLSERVTVNAVAAAEEALGAGAADAPAAVAALAEVIRPEIDRACRLAALEELWRLVENQKIVTQRFFLSSSDRQDLLGLSKEGK